MILLQHGIEKETKELVSIDDVTRGLLCNCICPCCGGDLVAKKSNIKLKQWHFSHKSKITCEHSGQTAAHLIAKDFIKEYGVYIPSDPLMTDELLAITGKIVVFDEVNLEKKFHDFIPDIIGIKNGIWFTIEVAVTHFVDYKKRSKIKKSGINSVEINLSSLKNKVDKNDIKNFLLDNEKKHYYYLLHFDKCLKKEIRRKIHITEKELDWTKEELKTLDKSIEKIKKSRNDVINLNRYFHINENGNFVFSETFHCHSYEKIFRATIYKNGLFWKAFVNDIRGEKKFTEALQAMNAVSSYIAKEIDTFTKSVEYNLIEEKNELENKIAKIAVFLENAENGMIYESEHFVTFWDSLYHPNLGLKCELRAKLEY